MRNVVINETLCFLRNKLGKVPEKQVREALVDYFDGDVLAIAKARLVDDIDSLKLDGMPYTAKHQSGPNRVKMEVDDLIKLFVFVDEKLQLDYLPIYVAENIDRIPTTRWLDGELQLLLCKLSNMELENRALRSDLSNMQSVIAEHNIKSAAELSKLNERVQCMASLVECQLTTLVSSTTQVKYSVQDIKRTIERTTGEGETSVKEHSSQSGAARSLFESVPTRSQPAEGPSRLSSVRRGRLNTPT